MKSVAVLTVSLAAILGATVDANASPTSSSLFSDNFQRTTGLGSNWWPWYGGFSTDGTYAVSMTPPSNPNTGNWTSVVPSLGTNDYSVSADIVLPPNSVSSGLFARSSYTTDVSRDLYAAQLWTDGTLNLYRRNAWAWTLLSSLQAGIVANTTYSVKLLVTGDSPVHLEVWLNGAQRINYDDVSPSRITQGPFQGLCGLMNYSAGVKYTNFTVSAVPHRIFSDVFARTTGLGANWTVPYGGFTTDGTYAVSAASPTFGSWAQLAPQLGTTDYTVSANITIPSSSLNSGLVARSQDADFTSTLYAAQLSTAGTVNLYRRNAWNWTLLQSKAAGIIANTPYDVTFSVSGSSPVHMEVLLNGTQTIAYDDNSTSRLTKGAAGLQNYNAGVKYSNFAVTAISTWPSGGDVAWTNEVNATTAGATIRKSGGTQGADDAGAVSHQSISAGNATFEHTVYDINSYRAAGLSHSGTWQGAAAMDYSFQIQAGTAQVYEGSIYRASTSVALNDVLRISAINGVVRYYKNGDVVYTSTVAPTYPLYAVTSLMDLNATVSSSKLFGRPLYYYTGGGCGPTALCASATFVSVSFQGMGFGTITNSPSTSINCSNSTTGSSAQLCSAALTLQGPYTLTASPSANSTFLGWGGACSGSGQCTIQGGTGSQKAVIANFDIVSPPSPNNYPCGLNTPCSTTANKFPDGAWVPYNTQANANNRSAFNIPVHGSNHTLSNSVQIVSRLLYGDLAPDNANHRPATMVFAKSGVTGWPTYWATSNDPLYKIDCGGNDADCNLQEWQIRIPSIARVQADDPNNIGADRHMTIIDQSQLAPGSTDPNSYLEVDLFQLSTSPVSNASGTPLTIFTSPAGSGGGYTSLSGNGQAIPINQTKGQANAGRVGNLAGRVRIEELKAALPGGSDSANPYIKHALAITVNCTNGTAIYPGTTDGSSNGMPCTDPRSGVVSGSNADAPPMGARFRLSLSCWKCGSQWDNPSLPDIDPTGRSADIAAWANIPEWKKVFLRTLIKFGAIVMDTGSKDAFWSWHFESDLQYIANSCQPGPGGNPCNPTSLGPWYNWAHSLAGANDMSENDYLGGSAYGTWDDNADGIADWRASIWSHLEVEEKCVSDPIGC